MKKIMLAVLACLVILGVAACTIENNTNKDNTGNPVGSSNLNDYVNNPGNIDTSGNTTSGQVIVQGTDQLKKFSSKAEIMNFIDSNQQHSTNYYGGISTRNVMMDAVAGAAPSASKMTASESGGSGQSSTDYSQTNVQVAGVDEADFVKNDDKYIYVISGDKLVIVNAFPADSAKIVSKTTLDGYPREMFVSGDKLILFIERGSEVYAFPQYDIMPRPIYKQKVHAVIYDISDRENPKVEKDYDIQGNYMTARMIGDNVYLISTDYVYYYDRVVDTPIIMEASGKAESVKVTPDIFYFDTIDSNYNFNTVMSINLKDDTKVDAKTFMMGYSNVIYVSENNIYISYQKSYPYYYDNTYTRTRFFDVVVPLLPSDVKAEVDSIKADTSLTEYEQWDRISAKLEEMYNSMSETQKQNLIDEMQKSIDEYEIKREEELRKTVIHKISIDNGALEYAGRGEVKGYLLNQFSMDESDGNLRVATTFNSWVNNANALYNNVYVLGSDMKIKGSLEKLAPDESIYSTRFLGDRLYMVTFKRIDPLFVIDLSNAADPKVLGQLKIPGFSDYLQPYDETHIIGLGKETADNEWGGTSVKGIKLALFDVSDVENPKQVDSYTIGEAGTDSEALNEHKAFLFDKEKNLLVIPVREVKGKEIYDARYGYYRQNVWQGAYAFTVTASGFDLKGKISHNEGAEDYGWYYGSPNAVRRSLFMDNVLYTISSSRILMNDLNDANLKELNDVALPYEGTPYPVPYYRDMAVSGGSAGAAEPVMVK